MEKFDEISSMLMGLGMSAGNTLLKNDVSFTHKEKRIGIDINKKKETVDGFVILSDGDRDYGNISDDVIVAVDACKKIITGGAPEHVEEVHAELVDVCVIDEDGTDMLKNEPAKETAIEQQKMQHPVRMSAPKKPVFAGPMIKGIDLQLAEIMAIRIGKKGKVIKSKAGNEFRPPQKLDHFIITTPNKDADGDFILDAEAIAVYGEKPTELDVILLSNDPTINFRTRYNYYKGGKCQCSGDGVDGEKLDGSYIKCDIEKCEFYAARNCKANGILSVILPKLGCVGGAARFRTTSIHSIRGILSSLMMISTITGGVLAGIPLTLTLTPKQVQPKEAATAHTVYIVNMVYKGGNAEHLRQAVIESAEHRQQVHAQIAAVESMASAALLTQPEETTEQINDIELEYYPDGVEK